MNDANIALGVDVNIEGGGKSLSDLKSEFKSIQSTLSTLKEGTKEYQRTLEQLGKVKDDIGDLRDTINALNPEGKVAAFQNVAGKLAGGFQAATGAAALFGVQSEDVEKQLLKVQAAMALSEGIKSVAGLGDAFAVLGTVIKSALGPVGLFLVALGAIAAAGAGMYKAFFEAESEAEKLTDQLGKLRKENELLNQEIKNQITALTGLKGNEEEILALKRKSIELSIHEQQLAFKAAVAKQIEAENEFNFLEKSYVLLGKTEVAEKLKLARTKEQRDATEKAYLDFQGAVASLKQIDNEVTQITIDNNQKKLEDDKKYLDEKRKINKANFDELVADRLEYNKAIEDGEKQDEERKKAEKEQKAMDDKADFEAYAAETDAIYQASEDTKVDITEKSAKRKKELNQESLDFSYNTTKQSLQATQTLVDLAFAHQLNQAKGNSAKELEIKKKQFQVAKAFTVASIILDTVLGGIKAISQNPPPNPVGIISAVLIGVAGTLATVKALTTKFEGGSAGDASAPAISMPTTTAAAPAIAQPTNTNTKINDDGTVDKPKTDLSPQKVYLVETDVTDKQKQVTRIEETAKIS